MPSRIDQALGGVIEAAVLVLLSLTPWLFGSASPVYELLILSSVAVLLVLWAARILVRGRLAWAKCPVTLCLAGLFLLGAGQLTAFSSPTLRWLSPATAAWYERLLPSAPEVLAGPGPADIVHPPPGSTISLYPYATRRELIRLLAVFLLFVIVRNNVVSAGALRRLSIVALINGTLLALFGLIQFFTSAHNTLYWTVISEGQVFGPFVNRNHFACYANLCLGLGLGLLLSVQHRRSSMAVAGPQPKRGDRDGLERPSYMSPWSAGVLPLLQDPSTLWISGGLAIIASSVVFSVSRGGFLSLLGASTICILLWLARSRRFWAVGAIAVTTATALGLLIWFGLDRVEARLSTLWSGEAFADARFSLLSRAWPIIRDFPWWGTGYGTFRYVEALYLHTPRDVGGIYEYAHNDYLEALIEGGLARFVLMVLAIAYVFRLSYRHLRSAQGQTAGGLALGALLAFTTVVLHSAVDFGLHIPAIAVFVTVLGAHLSGLLPLVARPAGTARRSRHRHSRRRRTGSGVFFGETRFGPAESQAEKDSRPPGGEPPRGADGWQLRLGGLAPSVAALTAGTLAVILVAEGWRLAQVERLRVAAAGLSPDSAPAPGYQIACLEAAARLAPGDAAVRVDLGQAHLDLYENPSRKLRPVPREEEEQIERAHLWPALRHFVRARDLCPLLPVPHVRLAANSDRLGQGQPRNAYLARARLLAPADSQLWYLCGLQALAEDRVDEAWQNWRRSLELSDRFLLRILELSSSRLDGDGMLERLLPEQSERILQAANYLDPPDAAPRHQAFLLKAAALLDNRRAEWTPDEWHLRAVLYRRLEQADEALVAYRKALAEKPLEATWRYELASLLYDRGQFDAARREVRFVLDQQPRHTEARRLSQVLAHAAAEGKGQR